MRQASTFQHPLFLGLALTSAACARSPAGVPVHDPAVVVAPTVEASAGAARPLAVPYVLDASSCRVAVGVVLEATRHSGPGPMSPRIAAMLERDPTFARAYSGISHGDQHIQCRYRVEINRSAYGFVHVVGNTFGKYEVGHCEDIRGEVAREIRDVTRSCADLEAGAYDGHVFTPL